MQQQTCKQRHIRTGTYGKVKVGNVAGRGMPGIDRHDFRAAHLLGSGKTLVQHRMAPRRIAADEHNEIGRIDVVVAAGHDVLPERPDVAGDRGRHAES
jgi:hypothetical protein